MGIGKGKGKGGRRCWIGGKRVLLKMRVAWLMVVEAVEEEEEIVGRGC